MNETCVVTSSKYIIGFFFFQSSVLGSLCRIKLPFLCWQDVWKLKPSPSMWKLAMLANGPCHSICFPILWEESFCWLSLSFREHRIPLLIVKKTTNLSCYHMLSFPQHSAGRSYANRAFNAALSNCTERSKTYLNYTPFKVSLGD